MACDYESTLQIAKDITVAALSNSPSVLADRDAGVFIGEMFTAIHDAVVKANKGDISEKLILLLTRSSQLPSQSFQPP